MSGPVWKKAASKEPAWRQKTHPLEHLRPFSLATPQANLLALQRYAGNSVASALIQRTPKLDVAHAQRKTIINQPGDPMEQEAERVAKIFIHSHSDVTDRAQTRKNAGCEARGSSGGIQHSFRSLKFRLLRAPVDASPKKRGFKNQESQTQQFIPAGDIVHTESGDFTEEDIRLFAAVIFAESSRKHPSESSAIGYVFKRKLEQGRSIREVAEAKTKGKPVYGTVLGQKGKGSREFRAFMGNYKPEEWTGFPQEKTVGTKKIRLPQTMEEYAGQIAPHREPFYRLAIEILDEVVEDPCPGAIGQGGMVDLFSGYPERNKKDQYVGKAQDTWWKRIREEGRYIQIGDTVNMRPIMYQAFAPTLHHPYAPTLYHPCAPMMHHLD